MAVAGYFLGGCLAVSWVAKPRWVGETRWILPWYGTLLAGLGIIVGIIYGLTASTAAAWGTNDFRVCSLAESR